MLNFGWTSISHPPPNCRVPDEGQTAWRLLRGSSVALGLGWYLRCFKGLSNLNRAILNQSEGKMVKFKRRGDTAVLDWTLDNGHTSCKLLVP